MRKVYLYLMLLFLIFLFSCGGSYKPDCVKPSPGDWASPDRIIPFYDPDWGNGVLVLNTNLTGKFCYGFVTYVSDVSGPVKVVPVPREKGKSILSGLAYDPADGVIFTGERSERKLYGIRYSDGKVVVQYSLDRNPLFVKYYDELLWNNLEKKKVITLLTSSTSSHQEGAVYLWEVSSLLEGKEPFASYSLKMKMPAGMVYVNKRFYIVPYDSGSLEIINLKDDSRKVIPFPYTSLSWGTTYIAYCSFMDEICINSNVVKKILFFNYREEKWDGEIDLDMKTYNFQEEGGELYISSYDPAEDFVLRNGRKEKLYTPERYSYIFAKGNNVYISDFNGDKFKVLER